MYHDLYHKIITVGKNSFEWYDINKDKSTIFAKHLPDYDEYADETKGYPENVWYSPFNPSISYCACATKAGINSWDEQATSLKGNLFCIDLREGICTTYHCHTLQDVGVSGADFMYLRF